MPFPCSCLQLCVLFSSSMKCNTASCHMRFSQISMLFEARKLCVYIPSPLSRKSRHKIKTASMSMLIALWAVPCATGCLKFKSRLEDFSQSRPLNLLHLTSSAILHCPNKVNIHTDDQLSITMHFKPLDSHS